MKITQRKHFTAASILGAIALCAATSLAFDGGTNTIAVDTSYNELFIGIDASNTVVTIADGVTVDAATLVSIGENPEASNNTLILNGSAALISGTTGFTTNSGGIIIGQNENGTGYSFKIDHSSSASASHLFMGMESNNTGRILVTDHSLLNIASNALIGAKGGTNTVTVSNGSTLAVGNQLIVGGTNSIGNKVTVGSESTLRVGALSNVVIHADNDVLIQDNGILNITGNFDTTELDSHDIDLASKAKIAVDQQFKAKGDAIDNGLHIVLNSSNATWNLKYPTETYAYIGRNNGNNSLTITSNSTTTLEKNLIVGSQAAADGNDLNIDGSSTFNAQKDVIIGQYGSNNDLNLTSGTANINQTLLLGKNTGATGNKINIASNGVLNVSRVVVGGSGEKNEFNLSGGNVYVTNNFILGSASKGNKYDHKGGTNTVAGSFILGETKNAEGSTTGKKFTSDTDMTTGNLAFVGTNAVVNIEQDLKTGMKGGGSVFVVRDGGIVNVDGNAVIGEYAGDNVIYLQRGSNTQFNVAGDLIIGNGEGQDRFAAYGGTANIAGNVYLGTSTNQHELRNFIHLQTTNAQLNVANAMYIGVSNSVNELDIVEGAKANVNELYVGILDGLSNNVVTVRGENSLLTVSNLLTIGSATGSNNTVNVKDGGILEVAQGNIVINGTNDTTLTIHDGGTLRSYDWDAGALTNSATNIIFNAGSTLELAGTYTGTNNMIEGGLELSLDDALSTNYVANWNVGSTNLVIGSKTGNNALTLKNGATATTGGDILLGAKDSTGNRLSIIGTNSTVNGANNLIVGQKDSSGNKFELLDGAHLVLAGNAVIGQKSSNNKDSLIAGSSNVVTSFTVSNDLLIGLMGSGNTLTVSSNTLTDVGGMLVIGTNGNNNVLTINGSNATLNVAGDAFIGMAKASGNKLEAENASLSFGKDLVIGNGKDSGSNSLLISGSNATLTVAGNLYSGKSGSGNKIYIEAGAQASAGTLYIGAEKNANNNGVSVTGTNTALNIASDIYVGQNGSGNSFTLEDASLSGIQSLYIGHGAGSDNNTATLSGSNTVLNVASNIYVGRLGSKNTLNLSGGIQADAQTLYIGYGTNSGNNTVSISGSNTVLTAANDIYVGQYGASNTFNLADGAMASAQNFYMGYASNSIRNTATLSGSNSTLTVTDDLVVGKKGALNTLTIEDDATVSANNLIMGEGKDSSKNTLTVTGSNTTLNVANDLFAGYGGSGNTLTISGGATVDVVNAYIGYASSNNTVSVENSNTVFTVLNNLLVGNSATNLSSENAFIVNLQATAKVGGNLTVSDSQFGIDAGSTVYVGGDYYQDETSTLLIGISTNHLDSTNLVVSGTAAFEQNTSIELTDADSTVTDEDTKMKVALVTSTNITISGQAASQSLLDNEINIIKDLWDFNLIFSNNTIFADSIIERSLADSAGFPEGSQLANVCDEIEYLANSNAIAEAQVKTLKDLGQSERKQVIENYYGAKESTSPAHNTINMGVQNVADQLTLRADNTRQRMGQASANAEMENPEGANGPHMEEQELQAWLTGFGTKYKMGEADGYDGYDGSLSGFMIGADLSVAEGVLVGLAGGSAGGTADGDDNSSTDTKTTYGALYVSMGTKEWFGDLSLIYGGSDVDTRIGTTFDTVGSYSAKNYAIYFGGGKEIATDYLIWTPQASLLGNYYKQEAYEETSTTATARSVDSFSNLYLQSTLGGSMGLYTAMGDVVFKPELRLFWLHEFNAKEEDVGYRLVGGSQQYNMVFQAPVSDLLRLGVGTSAKVGEYLELRADFDARFGADYSDYTFLGSLRYQF